MIDGSEIENRIAGQPWNVIESALAMHGWAVLQGLLTPGDCAAVAAFYDDPALFRSRVVMRRHGFGEGEYRYFAYPLPLQAAVLLSRPDAHFQGGEFVLTEQKPRSQSRPYVVPLGQGDAVIFAVSERPVQGVRGYYRLKLRHGVSHIRAGRRHTLGIIFHDAR